MITGPQRWKLLFAILAVLLWSGSGSGCRRGDSPDRATASAAAPASTPSTTPNRPTTPAPSGSATAHVPARGLWWKTTAGQATVYLLGSVHVARADLYPLDPRIEHAFASADVLVLEIDLTRINLISAAMKMSRAARYPAGDSLERHVSAATMDKLRRHAPGGLLSASTLQQFQPWFVATTILQSRLEKLGYDPSQGLDRHFADQAQGQKEVIGLETMDEQVGLFTQMPESSQVLMLEQTLDDLDQIEPTMQLVFEAWRRGDPKPIDEQLLVPLRTANLRPLFDKLFVTRNRNWTKEIGRYLQSDRTYFVVVGAGHLVGPDSVVDLLERENHPVISQWGPPP